MADRYGNMSTEAWLNSARESLNWTQCGVLETCRGARGSCPTSIFGSRPSCPTFSQGNCPGGWLACLAQSWEASGQSLEAMTQAHKEHLPHVLETIFQFGPQGLIMLIDVREFDSGNINLEALEYGVRLKISQKDIMRTKGNGGLSAMRTLERLYEFPYPIEPHEVVSNVRDGTLFLTIPWALPQETAMF